MAKIAVTGATGFVGHFVANYLEKEGHTVFRFGRKKKENSISWDITKGPYRDSLSIDCVVHCAADVDDWAPYDRSYKTNVVGTQNVLASFTGVTHFVYISSASVYDAFCKETIITEKKCLSGKFLNSYSRTKFLGEKKVEVSHIPTRIILRPHIIYGPGDMTIGPRIRAGIKGNYFPVPGNAKNRISFTHIENLSQAIAKSVVLPKKGLFIFNITDKKAVVFRDALRDVKKLNNMTFREIYIPRWLCLFIGTVSEVVYKIIGIKKSPLLSRYIVDQMGSDHVLDISAAESELDYKPTRTIEKDFLL